MKRIFLFNIVVLFFAVLSVSCNKSLETASIVVNTDELIVDSKGDRTTIGVKCNRDWEAAVDKEWVTLSPNSAEAFEASSYIIVTVAPNEDEDRTATITVRSLDGAVSASVNVVQGENGFVIKNGNAFVEYLNLAAEGQASNDYKLGRNIDLSGKDLPEIQSFDNMLDCQGYSISGWKTNRSLFNKIGVNGGLMNLKIDKSCELTIPAEAADFGFIASENQGTIQNIINEADIIITAVTPGKKGAVCGVNKGYVSGCANYGSVIYSGESNAESGAYYAGVVGQTTGENAKIEGCKNYGIMSFIFDGNLAKSFYLAGVVGAVNSNSKALDCLNEGSIELKSSGSLDIVMSGGIVAYAGGEVSGCMNKGDISYFAESADGMADGAVKATGVAGIACYEGWSKGVARNNENFGNITLRAGYSLGSQKVGSAQNYATNVAGVFAHMYDCGVSECKNSGKITSVLADIDNEASEYSTKWRQSLGGVVASSWGAVDNCENSGELNVVWANSLPEEGVARVGLNKQFVAQVGGISGGDYHSGQANSPIRSCVNSGSVNYICDARGSNNSLGGIVGWPNKEGASADPIVENCENTGDITADGYGKTRIGGITGGCTLHRANVNRGKVYLKNGYKTCAVGGVSGVMSGNYAMSGCKNYGAVVSDVKLAGAQGGSDACIGGLVGASYNQAGVSLTDCVVKCDVVAPEGSTAFMIIGVVGSNKKVTNSNIFGTETNPNYVAGGSLKLGTSKNEISSENYMKYSLPWGDGAPVNSNIHFNIIFDDAI